MAKSSQSELEADLLINLPVGLLTVIAAAKFVKESRSPKARRLDLGGVAILTLALTLLLYPLIQGREAGWPPWAFVCLAAFLPMMFLFVQYEKRVTAGGGSPLVELDLFEDRAFVIGLVSGMCFWGGTAAFSWSPPFSFRTDWAFRREKLG